jgi:hypothetical protein
MNDHVKASHPLNLRHPINHYDFESDRILAEIKAMNCPEAAKIRWMQAKGNGIDLSGFIFFICFVCVVSYLIWRFVL